MKIKRVLVLLSILLLVVLVLVFSENYITASEPIKILAASATSCTDDSLPVISLLDMSTEGYWKPKALDSGTDEGILIQFEQPTLIDWIEVKTKNLKNEGAISYYLDGRRNTSHGDKKQNQPERDDDDYLEYGSEMNKLKVGFIFKLGRKRNYGNIPLQPLNVHVKSVFIKVNQATTAPELVSIRFYKKDNKNPIPVLVPQSVNVTSQASSTLIPELAYQVNNLFDSRPDSAWATNGKITNGIGEKIDLQLEKPLSITGLTLWNGYQRSETHYRANARPSEIKVLINGEMEFKLPLKDVMGPQTVNFPNPVENVTDLSVYIEKLFTGASYKDVVISEVKLLDDKKRLINLNPKLININNLDLDNKVKSILDISLAPLMVGIGQNTEHDAYYEGFYPYRKLRLRSNGTFVIYSFYDDVVMEGNWESMPNGVRIFGKKYVTNPRDSEYMQAVKTKTTVKIFQANLEFIDLIKCDLAVYKKYFKTMLAERKFVQDKSLKPNYNNINWWMSVEPYEEAKIDAKTEDELFKKLLLVARSQKAVLIYSPLFTDLFVPSDETYQPYGWNP